MTGGTRIFKWLNLAGALIISGAPFARSQTAPVPTVSLPEAALAEAQGKAVVLEKNLPKPKVATKLTFDLSPSRQERFRKYLPKTWRTLSQREPLHMVALGDSVFEIWSDPDDLKPRAFPAIFAQELANRFFYTGGVTLLSGRGGDPRQMGPSIALRQLSRQGGGVLDSAGLLNAAARQMPVDLVLICYGQQDSAAGMSPTAFTRTTLEAVDAARKLGADVILCSPWLTMAQPAEAAWGITRPLSDALREVADQESILHVDLGDLSQLLQLTDSGTRDAPRAFEAVEKTYRALFHESSGGRFSPRASLHERLGNLVFQELMGDLSAVTWKVNGASTSQTKPDHLTLQFSLENPTSKAQTLTILPLIAGGWNPVEASPPVNLPPGGKQKMKAEYTRGQAGSFALEEPLVRLPILVCAGEQARVEDVRAPVQPLALVWTPATLFNQEDAFLAGCQIVNNSSKDASGTWQAEMGGKRLEGKFALKSQGTFPLDLRFDLPPASTPSQILPLVVTIKANGTDLSSRRQVEIVRNLGLDQPVALRPVDGSVDKQEDAVTLQATADPAKLILTCSVGKSAAFNQSADGGLAWQMDVNLDARSYGKRLERGATAALRITGNSVDGAAQVHDVASWAFGNEYAAVFDPKEFKAALSTAPDGRRLISLTVPKSYLYLHEWALNNGNSQLGLNVRFTVRQVPLDGQEKLSSYALSVNAKPVDDVESLVVLELSSKPTQRMTINVF